MISLSALQCGLDVFTARKAWRHGGAGKSLALTDLFIQLVEERCAGYGLGFCHYRVSTPNVARRVPDARRRRGRERPGQRRLRHRAGADCTRRDRRRVSAPVTAAMEERPAQRHPCALAFTPLYIGFEDVWNAVEHLRQVLRAGEWQKPEFNQTHAVT